MTRTLRTLCALTAIWLAWITGQTAGRVPAYVSVSLAAAAFAHVLFGVRESGHADELRQLRVQLERAALPTAVDHGPPLTGEERARFNRLIASLDLPGPDEPRSAA